MESYSQSSTLQRLTSGKLLATVGFIFVLLALVIVTITHPATGYEISIYDAYPWYFWFSLIAAIACGIIILASQAFTKKESKWWVAGFCVILLVYFILFNLASFRGYFILDRADTQTHIGWIKDIISTGHLGEELFYPALHILATNLSYVTSVDLKTIANIAPSFFVIFYMISMYSFSTKVATSRAQLFLILAFGCTLPLLIVNVTSSPPNLVFLFLPFVLLLYYMSKKSGINSPARVVPFVIVCLAIPFFHPLISLHLVLVLLCLELGPAICKWANTRKTVKKPSLISQLRGISINPCMIIFATFFIWFSHFYAFTRNIRMVADWLLYQSGTPQVVGRVGLLQEANLSTSEIAELFTKMHGHHTLYLLLSIFIIFVIWKNLFSSPQKISSEQVTFSLLVIVFSLVTVIYSGVPFGGGYPRALRWAVFASAILNGLAIYGILQNKGKRIIPFFIIILLMFSTVVGTFTTYFSPIIYKYNDNQVTKMEFQGMNWFFHHRDKKLLVEDVVVQQIRFADSLLGKGAPKTNLRHHNESLPDHFGYTNNKHLGEEYNSDRYLLTNKLSRVFYQKVFPNLPHVWRFTEKDFDKLSYDPTLIKIYNNHEFKVWRINGG